MWDGTWRVTGFDGGFLTWVSPDGEEGMAWTGRSEPDQHFDLLCPNTLAGIRARSASGEANPPKAATPSADPAPAVDQFAATRSRLDAALAADQAPAPGGPAPGTTASPASRTGSPYPRTGRVDCASPGTVAEFGLTGSGLANLTRLESTEAGLLEAGSTKTWSATIAGDGDDRVLTLDNGRGARVMATLTTGKGLVTTPPGSVASDILCRILVTPD